MTSMFKNLFNGKKNKSGAPTKTLGAPGFSVYGGYLQEDEKNTKLIGRSKYKTYSDILANTAIVSAGVRYFLNRVGKSKWSVQPADESAEAIELAERLEQILEAIDTPWHRIIRRAAMYKFYGFSIQEWTAVRREDGIIGIKDIAPRPQITIEQWDCDENGKVLGVVQRSPQTHDNLYIPRKKIVYVVDDTLNDSPEGLGLFRHVVEKSETLKRFEQLEAFGFETDLRGVPVGRVPFAELQRLVDEGAITTQKKAEIEKPIVDFIQNHIKSPSLGLILDSITYESEDESSRPSNVPQWDMQLLQASPSGQDEVAKAIERLNEELARVLGVEGLLLGSSNHGSQALSVDKSYNFALIIDSTLAELAEVFDKDFISVVWKLNGWDEKLKPKFKTEQARFKDVTQITTALNDLANAGAVLEHDDPAINEIRGILGLPDAPDLNLDDEDLALSNAPNISQADGEQLPERGEGDDGA